jgi:hypothetical protein
MIRSKGERTFWICTRERSKLHPSCPGKATTQDNMTVSTRKHNQMPDPTLSFVKENERKIVEMTTKHPKLKTSHLQQEWAKSVMSPAQRSKVMLCWYIQRKIQKAKNP